MCQATFYRVSWENHTPNSELSARSVFPLRAEEGDERLLNLVIPITDATCEELKNARILCDRNKNKSTVTHSFRETMKDLKLKEKLSGLGGVDSIICESRKEDWKTIDKIPESFPITHSAERAQSVYINNSYTKKMVKLKRNKEITRNAMD